MSASRKSTIDKAKYKAEYKRRYGEELPDEVYNTLGSKMNRKLKEIKDKIMKKKMAYGGKVKMMGGGKVMKAVPADNPGLKKLPTSVRNKMGYMKYGGKVEMMGGGYMDDEKKKMAYGGKVKMKKGGYAKKKMGKCPRDGMAMKGKTRAKRG